MAQTTSIVVKFGDPDGADRDAHLSAEIDRREDGPNGDNTSFEPGDTAYFLLYKSPNVEITDVIASAGTASLGETVSVQKSEDVVFAQEKEARISVPASGGISHDWLGSPLGDISVDDTKLTIAEKGVGVARVTYTADAISGKIESPAAIGAFSDFTIVVVIVGTTGGG